MYEIAKEVKENPANFMKLGYKFCELFRQGMTYQEVQTLMFNTFKNEPEKNVFASRVVNAATQNLCYYPTSGVASYAPGSINNNPSGFGGGFGGGGGSCGSPSDRASDGSRCGGRAASER